MNFPAVCSEWSEPHSHCTEGTGSDQYSGLGKWNSNALKIEGYFSFLKRLCINFEAKNCFDENEDYFQLPNRSMLSQLKFKGHFYGLALWDIPVK